MKRIHTLNYESYAIDYLDGNLSESDQRAFETFLERHPDIFEEIRDLDKMTVVAPSAHYPQRKNLYRGNSQSYYWAIAAGWALIIGLSVAFWFAKPTANAPLPLAEDSLTEAEPKVEIARVSTSAKKRKTDIHTPPMEPARIPGLENRLAPQNQFPQLTSPATEIKQGEVVQRGSPASTLPQSEHSLTIVKTQQKAVDSRIVIPNDVESLKNYSSEESIFNPKKSAVIESLSPLLSEDQKSWVSQWRPLESLKEEIDRDRWAKALTPEIFYSSKSTK
jgi:hypothetical protein